MTLAALIRWLEKAVKEKKEAVITIRLHQGGIREARIEQDINADS